MMVFCCGWRSVWCVLDTVAHAIAPWSTEPGRPLGWVCDRHDRAIIGD